MTHAFNQLYVHPHGSEGIGIIVWGSIFVSDYDLWASVVGGDALRLHFLPVRGRGTGQGMDWGKREQWMIEITQSPGFQCNCVGLHLHVSIDARKATFGQTSTAPKHLYSQGFHAVWKKLGKNRWGKENRIISEWGKGCQGMKAIFINKRTVRFLAVWPCRDKLIFAVVWFSAVSATYSKRIIKVTLQKAGSSPWHIYQKQSY